MNFIWPQALYLLLFIPLYIFLHIHFEKKKQKDLIPFGNVEVIVEAISKTKKIDALKHLPFVLKVAVLALLVFALSRPVSFVYVPLPDTKMLLLLDISISMEAEDMNPNRLIAAKEAAINFIQDLPKGIEIGLGLFSGSVRIIVNPTLEKTKTINVLKRLNLKSLEPGTAIGDAILAGIDSITFEDNPNQENKNNKSIVLITDGEANIGNDPLFSAAQAKINNIVIQTIGIGSPAGTIIRGGILTKLDEFTLQEIASLTGGNYFNAQNLEDMKKIYKKIKKTIHFIPKETEITFIPVIIIFALLGIYQILKWSKFRLG